MSVSLQPKVPGIAGGIELALRFVLWASDLHGEPTAEQISAQFAMSRSSGYRWRTAWRAARGIHASRRSARK